MDRLKTLKRFETFSRMDYIKKPTTRVGDPILLDYPGFPIGNDKKCRFRARLCANPPWGEGLLEHTVICGFCQELCSLVEPAAGIRLPKSQRLYPVKDLLFVKNVVKGN